MAAGQTARGAVEAALCAHLGWLRARLLAWTAALRWLRAAACAVGMQRSFQWRPLLVDASRAGYVTAPAVAAGPALQGAGAREIRALCAAVRALPDAGAHALRVALLAAANGAARGDPLLGGLAVRLEVLEGGPEGAAAVQRDGQGGAAEAPGVATALSAAVPSAAEIGRVYGASKGNRGKRRLALAQFVEQVAAAAPSGALGQGGPAQPTAPHVAGC